MRVSSSLNISQFITLFSFSGGSPNSVNFLYRFSSSKNPICIDFIFLLYHFFTRSVQGFLEIPTSDIKAFQNEMISAGLASPSDATWFNKLLFGPWAENGSATLLNEYENYSRNTSFSEMFHISAARWSEAAKMAVEIWAFGITEHYIQYMQNWHRITITDDFETVCKVKEKIDNGENVNPFTDIEQPYTGNRTLPSGNQSNEPRGQRSQKKSAGDQCENIAADVLAKNGYDIEFLPEDSLGPQKGNGYGISSNSNPDYLIEGRAFDCYAPQGNNVDSILKEMRKKTKNQSDRLVLYFSKTNEKVPNALTFTHEQVDELLIKILSRAHSNDSKLGSLKELIVIYGDEIYPAIWY